MFNFNKKLKIFSLVLILLGSIGVGIGFLSSPSNVDEALSMVSSSHDSNHDNYNEVHNNALDYHQEKPHDDEHHYDHGKHVKHQLQNRPWASIFVAAFFFFMIAMGTLVFYAIQRASQAGWPILLYRVMEGITGYLLPGSILLFLFLLVSGLHMNHIYVWMDPETVAHDEIIQGKVSYLNIPFFMLRALIYLTGWNLYRYLSRRLSIAQDNAEKGNIKNYKLNFKISAGFLAFFFVTESMMAWDWIMSIDPHWFSTLFGWYVLASSLVTSVTVIAITTIFLKSKGYLPKVNDSHIHDLAKFMFGLSIFWTYLWFSQYMLIWYSNIPEEVTYFLTRIDDYQLPFFGMIILNFVLPLLILISSEYKRSNWIIVMAGIIIIIGHYIDIFNMIMPGTVGDQWFIGIPELGAFTLFSGLYLYFVFNSLSKVPLEASGDPYIVESKKFIY
jgi:hypothetical protein